MSCIRHHLEYESFPGHTPSLLGQTVHSLQPHEAPTSPGPSLHLLPGLPAAFTFFSHSAAERILNQVLPVSCLKPSTISHQTCNEI